MNKIKSITLSSMLLAIGLILPQALHSIPSAANILLPMHIPVMLGGFILGPVYGLLLGILTPALSNVIFGMPLGHLLLQMIIELALYGLCTGLFNNIINIKNEILKIYVILIISMIIGRLGYGFANAYILNVADYSLDIWLKVAFIKALPGIIIQLILVPILVKSINKNIK